MADVMDVTAVANDDLSQLDDGSWMSTGEDPHFLLRFSFMRRPHLVVELRASDGPLDAKVYVNRGRGFREIDAVDLPASGHLVVQMDVGAWGTVRSVRIDPATSPGRLHFSAQTFSTAEEARAEAAARAVAGLDAHLVSLGSLPRFWTMVPHIGWRRRGRPLVTRYADKQYSLASALANDPPDGPSLWISIVVPVFNAPARYLEDLRRSFAGQKMPGAELILSDDASTDEETRHWLKNVSGDNIRVVSNQRNAGIASATNAGLEQARGIWVGLLDHDDVLAPHAFKVIAAALRDHPEAQFLYTDELVVNERLAPIGVMLKPAFDPVLLSGMNYINHFSVFRRDRLNAIGNLRLGLDGSQDYDLLLRYLAGVDEANVLHLPYPAYWWRRTGQTYSRKNLGQATQHARTALRDRFGANGRKTDVLPALTPSLHRLAWPTAESDWPKVSVIIPSRDRVHLITKVLTGLFERTDYPKIEVIVVDNGSKDPDVLDLYRRHEKERENFSVQMRTEVFNFSRAINTGMAAASGEHYLLLNNDIEVVEPGWLKEMVSCLNYSRTGIVGAKLLYPNGRMQHAGVIAGFGGLAGHWYLNTPEKFGGPMNRLHVRNSMTCITAATMLISGECARALGPWNEDDFAIAYNDVDYCLRAYKAGWRAVWTPFAKLIHHESASRGADLHGSRRKRFDHEKARLRALHQTSDFLDPALSPAESRDRTWPRLTIPEQLAPARKFYHLPIKL